MNRRHFIAMLGMAPVAIAVVKLLPQTNEIRDPRAWQPNYRYELGDIIVIDGLVDKRKNGTYWMNGNRIFERID